MRLGVCRNEMVCRWILLNKHNRAMTTLILRFSFGPNNLVVFGHLAFHCANDIVKTWDVGGILLAQ